MYPPYLGVTCHLRSGDGEGGTEIYEGKIPEDQCIIRCMEKRKKDPTLTGVTIGVSGPNVGKCYCEYNMKNIVADSRYKSCMLLPGMLYHFFQLIILDFIVNIGMSDNGFDNTAFLNCIVT